MNARHSNGNSIYTWCEVSDNVKFEQCSVQGNSFITDGVGSDSTFLNTEVFGGVFRNSQIEGGRIGGEPFITKSRLTECVVGGSPIIHGSMLHSAVIWDAPDITNVHLFGDIKISGDAKLIGPWKVVSAYGIRLHRGTWRRPPRFLKFDKHIVSECTDGHAHVDCYCRPMEWWQTKGVVLGRRLGWMPEEINALYQVFDEWSVSAMAA